MSLLIWIFFLKIYFTYADSDGPWSLLGFSGYSGEIVMNNLTGSSLFYWLFQAYKGNILTDKLPIILWLQGGPGCSGETGMLFENIGAFNIDNSANPFINPYTWATDFHVIAVDYPFGAGFSFANAAYDMKNTTIQASAYLYNFLVKLSNKYPTWLNRDLYIFGSSYAGHWVPGIAYTILMNNLSPNSPTKFQLKGIGIGDPWIEALTQTQYYSDYAYQHSLIDNEEINIIEQLQAQIVNELNSGNLLQANSDRESILSDISSYAGGIDPLNVRYFGNHYNLGNISNWLNSASTKTLLHAPANIIWSDCNGTAGAGFIEDKMTSMASYFPFILDNIKVVIWSGQDDLRVNSMGTQALLAKMNWSYINNFLAANKIVWAVNGQVAGYVTTYNSLTFISMLKAGHLASHDQPLNAKDMAYRFINNAGWQ
ncbi:unnamed protein product [Blepharisma stoltei]|uniref:Uncharacterized protein n=1 Tax=Blepharisma stoltei TaxID=1481888 RepID=A0AAU9K1K1_9CILI|nr:unnamed protein product [Blepharisma stoltei]